MASGLLDIIPTPPSGKTGWPWSQQTEPAIYDPGMDWPKISIVTPSYNQGAFIEETIRSVLLQNYPNLEYVVIDGGSTDESIKIIENYESWITSWVSESDRGQSHAINKGFKKATGEILAWLNSDDYFAPGALYHIASNWQEDSQFIVGNGHKVNLEKQVIYSPRPAEITLNSILRWLQNNNFMQPAVFFSKEAWNECGPLDESLDFCMDVDLWLKIAQKFPAQRLNETLAFAYAHPDAKTTAQVSKMKLETSLLVAKYGYLDIAKEEGYKIIEEYEQKIETPPSLRTCLNIILKKATKRIKKAIQSPFRVAKRSN